MTTTKSKPTTRRAVRRRKVIAPCSASVSAGDSHCLVALTESSTTTGRVAVIDHRTGQTVRFPLPKLTLFAGVTCARLRSLGIANGLHMAKLPTGEQVHVRDLRDSLASSRGMKLFRPDEISA
jgi:hypothetical protein